MEQSVLNSLDSDGQAEWLPTIQRDGGCLRVIWFSEDIVVPELKAGLCFLAYRCWYDCNIASLSDLICFDTEVGRNNPALCPKHKARLLIATQTLQNAHSETKAVHDTTHKPAKGRCPVLGETSQGVHVSHPGSHGFRNFLHLTKRLF